MYSPPHAQIYDIRSDSFELKQRLDQAGHRSDVRALVLSSDDATLISASNAGAKIWSAASGACVGTLEGGYGLCCVFAPGNRHAVIGTKVGCCCCFGFCFGCYKGSVVWC